MRTTVLEYDTIGRICPNGMTHENCHFRKVLNDWQKQYDFYGPIFGFGYKVLENGNLLIPKFYSMDAENGPYFRLKEIIDKTCKGTCCLENRDKKSVNSDEVNSQLKNQTIVCSYTMRGMNCPAGMSRETCPLRKKMSEIEEKYTVGYKVLGQNVLLIPNQYYNSKMNLYMDVSQIASDICSNCFERNYRR